MNNVIHTFGNEVAGITIKQFLELIFTKLFIERGYTREQFFIQGRTEGWLYEQEDIFAKKRLERRAAARILHGILGKVIKEADESDWSAAMKLKDLFDCGTCVMHVAQMYVKGIMEAVEVRDGEPGEVLFDMTGPVSEKDAELFLERLLKPSMRVPEIQGKSFREAVKLGRKEAERLLADAKEVFVINVGQKELTETVTGAIWIPMLRILENPYILEKERDKLLLLFCEAGAQSEIAANCLADNGYCHVAYFGLQE